MDAEEPRLDRQSYVRLTVTHLWEHLPLVSAAALLFSAAAAPAVVLLYVGALLPALLAGAVLAAPAWAALLALEGEVGRGAAAGLSIMLKAFPRFWTRAARLGLLMAFPAAMLALTLPLMGQTVVSHLVWLGIAADLFGLVLAVVLSLYAFPLLVLYDAPVILCLRDAFALAGRHVGNTFGLVSMGVLFGFAVVRVSPALALGLPAVWGIFIVNHCRMVVDEARLQ